MFCFTTTKEKNFNNGGTLAIALERIKTMLLKTALLPPARHLLSQSQSKDKTDKMEDEDGSVR